MAERTGCPILLSLWSYVTAVALKWPIPGEAQNPGLTSIKTRETVSVGSSALTVNQCSAEFFSSTAVQIA